MSAERTLTPDELCRIQESILPEACALRGELVAAMEGYQEEARESHLQSPSRQLAIYLSRQVQGGRVTQKDLGDLVHLLTGNAFLYRARKLRRYVGETGIAENTRLLTAVFEGLAHENPTSEGGDGVLLPFAEFRARVEREIFGIVITAHPTFSISQRLTRILAQLASGTDGEGVSLSGDDVAALVREATQAAHGDAKRIDLEAENAFALMAIGNIHAALERVYGVILDVASRLYPEDWRTLTPRVLTVASWVGYDLDGRSDIGWSDTLCARMVVEAIQIKRYRDALHDFAEELDQDEGRRSAVDALRESALRLVRSHDELCAEIETLKTEMSTPDAVAAFARRLSATLPTRLVHVAELIDAVNTAIAEECAQESVREDRVRRLSVLRAEMANFGLAHAHTHVRINANQLTNAIRKQIGLDGAPDDSTNKRRFMRELNELLDDVETVAINFGSILSENMSARRIFMVVAKMLKYVDADEPVRFLIAECNTSFTVLCALYFAKLFGVESKIDISPLFETPVAMEHGHDIIGELLENPHYRDYIRVRGRLCIQTGFSDAGRYIGQVSASLAIERIRMLLARRLAKHDLVGIDLVIFDTHGESIGRGAHPVSFADRLDYTYPPASRAAFARAGVFVKQEVSFQGGDGYVYFSTPDMAFATVCRLLTHAVGKAYRADDDPDVFYEDTDYSLDFFLTAKDFNDRLIDNPDYAGMLNLFGPNLMYPTGSRKVKRQYEGAGAADQSHPSQIRAIPHNSILQQIGYLSNSMSGIGKAIAKDPDRFVEIFAASDRCRRFVSLVASARNLSNLDAMNGYVALYDPVIWLRRAFVEKDPKRAQQMQLLARLLRTGGRHEEMNRVLRIFLNDTLNLDRGLEAVKAETMLPDMARACYPDLDLLHAVRIALIHEIFLLATQLPKFTSHQEFTMDDVISDILHLDLDHALEVLCTTFPKTVRTFGAELFGEPASYQSDDSQSYQREHAELFEPMRQLYDLVRRVSTAIAHIVGAVG
ncbi:phosphoenolpyruvate carboxylase [Varunaivibrio sulfuroxidans]|uniref:phosphoenolpyruvate carboxylase n=1 Tax=Varunaivibrio sulfuroxidans TaxID=1773489 RepID=UPI001047DA7C|nr:phosphoenolpyruvate carboxylase [Varunaivibrio sulfuroxidans]WES30693.1 phosphoenolpyruvate carboxylase [Varunaivibrio sulfuroxidans]